jgi:hypothetical protein
VTAAWSGSGQWARRSVSVRAERNPAAWRSGARGTGAHMAATSHVVRSRFTVERDSQYESWNLTGRGVPQVLVTPH